jgi:TolB protein
MRSFTPGVAFITAGAVNAACLLAPAYAGEPQIWDKIVFVSTRDVNGNFEVYVTDWDGSNQVNLTNHPASDWEPVVSPDGKKIAFTSDRDEVYGIYIMDTAGSGVKRLTPSNMRGSSAAFSPDGGKIAFTSVDNSGKTDIFTINVDGTGLYRLTKTDDADEIKPRYHPDGETIIYSVSAWIADEYICEIFTMNKDGSGQERFTYGEKIELSPGDVQRIGSAYPIYFPDAERIAFWSSDLYEDGIYVMNADGIGRERLTHDGSYPAVSPDGTKIAYDPGYLRTREIYLINVDGTGETRLTVNSVPDSEPSFAPMLVDGRLLDYYGHWHEIEE